MNETSHDSTVRHPEDVGAWLASLRETASSLRVGEGLERALAGLSRSVDHLRSEHRGMANELLSVYEQIGIVFEVTRRLPEVHDEKGVIELFLRNLQRSYHEADSFVVDRQVDGSWRSSNPRFPVDDMLRDHLSRAIQNRRVSVEPSAGKGGAGRWVETLVGPVFSGEEFVCAIVLGFGPHSTQRASSSFHAFLASDVLLMESLTMFCGDLIRNHRLVNELRQLSFVMVRALVNAVDQKDEYTSGHSIRVGFYSSLLGRGLDLQDDELLMLQWSALLHDVGKIGIRDDVLKKTGKLTTEEFDHIKEHPVRSFKVVKQVPQLSRALDGVLHHHERYDGSGYPHGLAGEAIPLQARIIQIADVFDALTSTRSYRPAYPWSEALDVMANEAGKTIDPGLQAMFDRLIRDRLNDDAATWERLNEQANRFYEDFGRTDYSTWGA